MKGLEQTERLVDDGVIRPDDPIQVGLGIMVLVMPAAMAFQIAVELQRNLLDRYDLVPGIPTAGDPEPQAYFKLKEEVE